MSAYIQISESERDGLQDMLDSLGEDNPIGDLNHYIDLPIAFCLLEIAKAAPDKEEWFVRGKWATIQSLQSKCTDEMKKWNYDQ